jgi:hypothetical protein
MQITQQLAVFLENKPGTLARICDALAEARIKIFAITTSDTIDHSVTRLVLSHPRKALLMFEERGTLVVEDVSADVSRKPKSISSTATAPLHPQRAKACSSSAWINPPKPSVRSIPDWLLSLTRSSWGSMDDKQ